MDIKCDQYNVEKLLDELMIRHLATPEKVREQVMERLKIFSEGGGFVFSTIHNILPDVPPENIVAMLDAINLH